MEVTKTVSRKPNNVWEDSYGYKQFQLTEGQQELANKIIENDLVFVDAPAGTGKSLSILHTYAKMYLANPHLNLIVIRTPVEAGMDKIGALPDSYSAKVAPHFASTKKILEQLLNRGKVETDMDHRIQFCIPNFVLGATFDRSLIFIDEAQQLSPAILKLLLERIGVGSKCVVAGDSTQLYTSNDTKRNALKDAIPRFFHADGSSKYDSLALHRFGVSEVMRSEIVKTVITAYTGLI